MENKKDYNPPGWLVTVFTQVTLDPIRAQAFDAFRTHLCESLGKDNDVCQVNNLWMKALDLLLANETALLAKVEKL